MLIIIQEILHLMEPRIRITAFSAIRDKMMLHVFCNLEDFEDGYQPMCDMTFEIIEKKFDEASSSWRLAFRADAAPYDPVGFEAVIPVTGWREQVDGEGDSAFHSFWGPVTLKSRGTESDRLLTLLADYYNIPMPHLLKRGLLSAAFGRKNSGPAMPWRFADTIECLAVGLASDPAMIADAVVQMKLFFDEGIEDGHYAEVFFNVDMPKGFGALNEKDEAYRADLVHWFSLPGNVRADPYADQP